MELVGHCRTVSRFFPNRWVDRFGIPGCIRGFSLYIWSSKGYAFPEEDTSYRILPTSERHYRQPAPTFGHHVARIWQVGMKACSDYSEDLETFSSIVSPTKLAFIGGNKSFCQLPGTDEGLSDELVCALSTFVVATQRYQLGPQVSLSLPAVNQGRTWTRRHGRPVRCTATQRVVRFWSEESRVISLIEVRNQAFNLHLRDLLDVRSKLGIRKSSGYERRDDQFSLIIRQGGLHKPWPFPLSRMPRSSARPN
jgi:hypothetical protein